VKLIEGTGADDNDGLKIVCANCSEDFDERGGIVFDISSVADRRRGKAGLCPDCSNEVVALVGSDPGGQ
jgi:hypothetical protein